jgi:hypothetical protein
MRRQFFRGYQDLLPEVLTPSPLRKEKSSNANHSRAMK